MADVQLARFSHCGGQEIIYYRDDVTNQLSKVSRSGGSCVAIFESESEDFSGGSPVDISGFELDVVENGDGSWSPDGYSIGIRSA